MSISGIEGRNNQINDCLPGTSAPSMPASPTGPNFTPPPPAPSVSYYQGGYNPGYAVPANNMNYGVNPYGVMRTNYYPNYYPANQGYNYQQSYGQNYATPYYWYGYLTR